MTIRPAPYWKPAAPSFRWSLADLWLELRIRLAAAAQARANADYDRAPTDYARELVRETYFTACGLRSQRLDAVMEWLNARHMAKVMEACR